MKKSYYVLILLLAGLFAACEKSDLEYGNDYIKSYRAWLGFKQSSGNSYRYTVNSSSWIGIATETTITVRSGKVTGRSFVLKAREPNSNALVIKEEWQEEENTLNTHSSGAATITLDEIYAKAKSDWLTKRENATTYFETKNSGMISLCGYIPGYCADDCFVGIYISSIERM